METQLDLFAETGRMPSVNRDYLGIRGLTFCPDFLDRDAQKGILREIDKRPWLDDLKRRVQHYGYRYDYKARRIDPSMYVGNLPPFAIELGNRLVSDGHFESCPDQVIVNEYQPGQGILAHVDCEPCFLGTIATISLGSTYEMEFTNLDGKESCTADLVVGSVLVLADDARYQWKHGIKARKSDNGRRRGRRVSLTFRNVILDDTARPSATED